MLGRSARQAISGSTAWLRGRKLGYTGDQVMLVRFGWQLTLLAWAACASAVACGTGAPQIPPELLGGQGGEAAPSGYPSGPYGASVGDVVPNLRFQAFLNPGPAATLERVEFSDLYSPRGERALLLLNTAAVWCQPCQIEHEELPQRVLELGPKGLTVLSLIYQDAEGQKPKLDTLQVWTQTFNSNFPVGLDPEFQMGWFGPADTPPLNVVVDLRDMKVLAVFLGNQGEGLWTFIERELATP